MGVLDWIVVGAYFLVMVWIGWWSRRRIKNASDFFVAGGKIPWWLVGISHHMSGYSAAVFVGYAALAYTVGFAVYVWWAISIAIACLLGAVWFAPRWPRLRKRLGIISPLEYLAVRYSVPVEQLLAWSGALLKLFDIAAKWTASAILLNVFAGIPIVWGVLLVGGVTMFYSTIGGIWADVLTDLGQFIIQFVAALALAIAVMIRLDGLATPFTMWSHLPESHSNPFNGSLTVGFFLAYIVVTTLSYNGGTWNLAMRMISAEDGHQAKRSMWFSAGLYLVWPLVLFFPMWAAPILLPGLAQPDESYALMATELLPDGLVGLVLAGMFAHTMAMTSSDSNAIASVVVRDIIPQFRKGKTFLPEKAELFFSRLITFLFIASSMAIALTSDSFGGVLGLIILWFGALVGPVAVPMLFGMLQAFRRSGSAAALISTAGGLIMFTLNQWVITDWVKALGDNSQAWSVATPVLVSLVLFAGIGWIRPENTPETDELIDSLCVDDTGVVATSVPTSEE